MSYEIRSCEGNSRAPKAISQSWPLHCLHYPHYQHALPQAVDIPVREQALPNILRMATESGEFTRSSCRLAPSGPSGLLSHLENETLASRRKPRCPGHRDLRILEAVSDSSFSHCRLQEPQPSHLSAVSRFGFDWLLAALTAIVESLAV